MEVLLNIVGERQKIFRLLTRFILSLVSLVFLSCLSLNIGSEPFIFLKKLCAGLLLPKIIYRRVRTWQQEELPDYILLVLLSKCTRNQNRVRHGLFCHIVWNEN